MADERHFDIGVLPSTSNSSKSIVYDDADTDDDNHQHQNRTQEEAMATSSTAMFGLSSGTGTSPRRTIANYPVVHATSLMNKDNKFQSPQGKTKHSSIPPAVVAAKNIVRRQKNRTTQKLKADQKPTLDDLMTGRCKVSQHVPSWTYKTELFNKARPLYGDRHLDAIDPPVVVGSYFFCKRELANAGVHRDWFKGIHYHRDNPHKKPIAESICLSGGYTDNLDMGETVVYAGRGLRAKDDKSSAESEDNSGNKGRNRRKSVSSSLDQPESPANQSMMNACDFKSPIRVVRNSQTAMISEFAPLGGYRYDGLYLIVDYEYKKGQEGNMVYLFYMQRLPNQAPPPWYEGVIYGTTAPPNQAPPPWHDEEIYGRTAPGPAPMPSHHIQLPTKHCSNPAINNDAVNNNAVSSSSKRKSVIQHGSVQPTSSGNKGIIPLIILDDD